MKNTMFPKPYRSQLSHNDVERVLRQAHVMRGRFFASVADAAVGAIAARARQLAAWIARRAHLGNARHA